MDKVDEILNRDNNKSKPLAVRIDEDNYIIMKAIAQNKGVSMSKLIRAIITNYAEENKKWVNK